MNRAFQQIRNFMTMWYHILAFASAYYIYNKHYKHKQHLWNVLWKKNLFNTFAQFQKSNQKLHLLWAKNKILLVNSSHFRFLAENSKLGRSGNTLHLHSVQKAEVSFSGESRLRGVCWGGRETTHQLVAAETWRHRGDHVQGAHCPTVQREREQKGQTLWACCYL